MSNWFGTPTYSQDAFGFNSPSYTWGAPSTGGLAGYNEGLLGSQTPSGSWLDQGNNREQLKSALEGTGKALEVKQLPMMQAAPTPSINLQEGQAAKLLPFVLPQYRLPLLELIKQRAGNQNERQ